MPPSDEANGFEEEMIYMGQAIATPETDELNEYGEWGAGETNDDSFRIF